MICLGHLVLVTQNWATLKPSTAQPQITWKERTNRAGITSELNDKIWFVTGFNKLSISIYALCMNMWRELVASNVCSFGFFLVAQLIEQWNFVEIKCFAMFVFAPVWNIFRLHLHIWSCGNLCDDFCFWLKVPNFSNNWSHCKNSFIYVAIVRGLQIDLITGNSFEHCHLFFCVLSLCVKKHTMGIWKKWPDKQVQ